MNIGIQLGDLTPELRKKLGILIGPNVDSEGNRLIALGKVLRALKGLDNDQAFSVLQEARKYVMKQGQLIEAEAEDNYTPPITWVVQVVAKVFQLKPQDLKQRKRDNEVATARHIAMYILSMTDKYTLFEIGAALGGRTPSAVGHGFQRIARLVESKDVEIIKWIEKVKAEL